MIRYRLRRKGDYSSLLTQDGKYKLEYRPGSVVTAPKGTLGIFCFKTKKDAESFKRLFAPGSGKTWEIYKVESKKRGRRPDLICGFITERHLDLFYGKNKEIYSESPIFPDIICHDEVKVLN